MLTTFATSYNLSEGVCTIDGVVQSSTDACTSAAGTAAWIVALIFIPLLIIGLAFFVFWVFMLIHAIKNEDLKDRTVWLAVLLGSFVLGSSWLAAIIYYFLAKRPYDRDKVAEATIVKPKPVKAKATKPKSSKTTKKNNSTK